MGSQHLNLKWRNHHSNLLSVFSQLLTSETFADVTIACEGTSIRAHKMILSACSPFFHNLFAQHPCQHPIVILKDVPFRDLKVLVDFMYSGEVNIAQEFLPSFLQTAESLKIKGLSENDTPGTNCSTPTKRNVQLDSRITTPSKFKRRRISRIQSDDKTDDESVDAQEDCRKGNASDDSNVLNSSPYDLSNTSTTNRYSSPRQRFEQAYNWGISTESSKYVEVNLQEDDTNTTAPSVSLAQDDSTTDPVGADSDSPQESKPFQLKQGDTSDIESLRQLQKVTGLMSTVTTNYSGSTQGNLDSSTPGVALQIENKLKDSDKVVAVTAETHHVLTRLPRHKKKDCIVCGNRQAGQRRRSRQWCPGCNVGVHVHCFHKLVHYRRSNKRTSKSRDVVPFNSACSETTIVKFESYSEVNVESNIESDSDINVQRDIVPFKSACSDTTVVKFEPCNEVNVESNIESDSDINVKAEMKNINSEVG